MKSANNGPQPESMDKKSAVGGLISWTTFEIESVQPAADSVISLMLKNPVSLNVCVTSILL